jgi:sugar lactone lactonase YvrE
VIDEMIPILPPHLVDLSDLPRRSSPTKNFRLTGTSKRFGEPERGGLPAGTLLFSDIPPNRVHRWKAGETVGIFLEPSGSIGPATYGKARGSNGLALDRQGQLVPFENEGR